MPTLTSDTAVEKPQALDHSSLLTLDEVLDSRPQLPPSMQVLPRLLSVLSDPDADLSDIVELVSLDPALTARVLQQCNSACFGAADPVHDLREAVNRLGFRFIYRMVALLSSSSVLRPSGKDWGVNGVELWKHSITAALAAQHLAQDTGEDASLLFTAGLLHDVGKFIMAEVFQQRYAVLFTQPVAGREEFAEREQAAFGFHHAELGASLLARWQFPTLLVTGIGQHHPLRGAAPRDRVSACLSLANAVAYLVDTPSPPPTSAAQLGALRLLDWPVERLTHYVERAREDFAFVNMCQLN